MLDNKSPAINNQICYYTICARRERDYTPPIRSQRLDGMDTTRGRHCLHRRKRGSSIPIEQPGRLLQTSSAWRIRSQGNYLLIVKRVLCMAIKTTQYF